ncbi:MAG: hypothetical protein WBB16_03420 [Aestuariivirga sp.]
MNNEAPEPAPTWADILRSRYLLPFYLICGFAISVGILNLWLNGYFGSYSWRQKLTIEVETPAGPVTGSAVTAVRFFDDNIMVDGAQIKTRFKGEAVTLDLGRDRYLFALLSHFKAPEYIAWLAPKILWERDGVGGWDAIAKAQSLNTPLAIPPKHYPMLVTFADINDPKSVKLVDPGNLAATFGPGYSLKSIALEITEERVTDGKVENVLAWILELQTRLIPTNKKHAKDYFPVENVGPEYFVFPYRFKEE